MAYTTINKPSDHFRIKTYAGNSTASRGITFDESSNMKPDWVWIKELDAVINHYGFDAVRGATKALSQNTSGTESTKDSTWFNSFDTNGFTIGTEDNINDTGDNYIAWCWKASNATAISNTDGSITSSVSANTTAGFSIVTYTGTGSAATVGHGLNSAPTYMVIKNLGQARNWANYHSAYSPSKNAEWNTAIAAESNGAAMYNSTAPTSSVFSVGTATSTNESGENFVAYCFHEVKGYSKIGTYIGQGSAKPFVYTGFKPAFLIIKRTAGTDEREIYNSKRLGYNSANYHLNLNDSAAEATLSDRIDLLSNGFKITATSSGPLNADGAEYNYIAIAEAPIVGTNNVPATAR